MWILFAAPDPFTSERIASTWGENLNTHETLKH